MRILIAPTAPVRRTLVKQPAAVGRTLVRRVVLPTDALRFRIDDAEVYLELLNAAGTVVAKVPYVPPE